MPDSGVGAPGEFVDTLHEHNVAWRGGVDWKIQPDTLLYASVAKGYEPGGFPNLTSNIFSSSQAVTQESVLSYEGGAKAGFFVSVESGIGWVPFLLEALAYQSIECKIDHPMSIEERFRRNIYVCSWFERKDYVHNVRSIGADNVMFETDFPHPTCLYPKPMQYLSDPLAELTFDERYKVLGGNAERIYNLDLQRQ